MEQGINKMIIQNSAYEEKFNRMHYMMHEDYYMIDNAYPVPDEYKNDYIEILGFKQDMSKKTVITSESSSNLTFEHLLGRKHDPAMEDDEAYNIYFRFLPKAQKDFSMRHLNMQTVSFKEIPACVAHLNLKYNFACQILQRFYDEQHLAIRSFGAIEKNVYFSILNRQRDATHKSKKGSKKVTQKLTQDNLNTNSNGSSQSSNEKDKVRKARLSTGPPKGPLNAI